MKTFFFFTDGATAPTNPGPSAYAYVETPSYHDNREIHHKVEFVGTATNNIVELRAIRELLAYILKNSNHYLDSNENIINIYSDSQYAINAISLWYPQWVSKRKLSDKLNVDIIAPAYNDLIAIKKKCAVILQWVKGHSGVWGNERADQLCVDAIAQSQQTYLELEFEDISTKDDKTITREINVLKTSINALIDEFETKLGELKLLYEQLTK